MLELPECCDYCKGLILLVNGRKDVSPGGKLSVAPTGYWVTCGLSFLALFCYTLLLV